MPSWIAARAHAADMMIHGFMGHTASTGQSFQGRMQAFVGDVTKYPSLGENAARDTQDTPVDEAKAQALFQQWVQSRVHRKVMVNRSFQLRLDGRHPARQQDLGGADLLRHAAEEGAVPVTEKWPGEPGHSC